MSNSAREAAREAARKAAQFFGREGGNARAAALSAEERIAISRKAANARWKKYRQAQKASA